MRRSVVRLNSALPTRRKAFKASMKPGAGGLDRWWLDYLIHRAAVPAVLQRAHIVFRRALSGCSSRSFEFPIRTAQQDC